MNIYIEETYDDMSRRAADIIGAQLIVKPESALGLATGTTPVGLYAALVDDFNAGRISFADASSFNLDEYRGLAADHPQSYHRFMQEHLFGLVDIHEDRTMVPDGANPDADEACNAYEQAIVDAGGIDLQLLGLGHNGHIGFNEPCDSFPVRTHLVQLTESTIQANSRLFSSEEEVPREAYTMGIGTIMRARAILVVASGADKARVVRDAFFGPVCPQVPASVLQLHQNVTVVLDAEAGALCA